MCGIFGIFDHENAAALVTLGLHSLQHRGQEGAGIVTTDGDKFHGLIVGPASKSKRRYLEFLNQKTAVPSRSAPAIFIPSASGTRI